MEVKKIRNIAMALMLATSLSGCAGFFNKLDEAINGPKLSPIENPTDVKGYKPVSMPEPTNKYAGDKQAANSLWQQGSAGFFKDQRAAKVGDIITVKISAKDGAKIENETEQKRDNNVDSMGIGAFGGYEGYMGKVMPGKLDTSKVIDVTSNRDIKGEGKIDRKENIDVTMAAIVTQVLSNDNLVIEGTQEIRVNYELRQLSVKGVIRRADISSDNTIESSKIAELRVSYGGRGTVSDMQNPRYGRQLIDIIAPF